MSAFASSTLLWCGRCSTSSMRLSVTRTLAPESGSSEAPTCFSSDSTSRQCRLPLGGSWKIERIRLACRRLMRLSQDWICDERTPDDRNKCDRQQTLDVDHRRTTTCGPEPSCSGPHSFVSPWGEDAAMP